MGIDPDNGAISHVDTATRYIRTYVGYLTRIHIKLSKYFLLLIKPNSIVLVPKSTTTLLAMTSTSSEASVTFVNWPSRRCNCGMGLCKIKIARTNPANRGRHYYDCPNAQRKCSPFIGWCDEYANALKMVAEGGMVVPEDSIVMSEQPFINTLECMEVVDGIRKDMAVMKKQIWILKCIICCMGIFIYSIWVN